MKTAEKMRMVGQPLEMGDSLTRYLQEISYHDLLTADEEVELAQAIESGRVAEEQLASVSVRGAEKVRLQRAVQLVRRLVAVARLFLQALGDDPGKFFGQIVPE